jgi:co-chaperonin GroES (HSP10)
MIKEKINSNAVDSKKRVPMPKEKDVNNLGVVSSRLLVYRILPRKVSKGGIIVPVEALESNEVEYPHFGVVMCAGPDIQDMYDYGDFVYYNQFAGRYAKDHESEIEYILIDENDVLMVNKSFNGYKDGFLI